MIASLRALALSLLLQAAATVAHAAAQAVRIPDAVECRGCTIDADTIAIIGDDPEGPALSRLSSIAMDSSGYFYVGSTYEPGELAVFGPHGEYLRSFGRSGSGPGEFSSRLMRVRVGPREHVHVIEGPRYTVLSPKAESFLRLHTLPFLPRGLGFTGDGRLVVSAFPVPSRGPVPLVHVIGSDGQVHQSFVELSGFDVDHSYQARRVIASGPGATLWVGRVSSYEIGLWSLDGGRRLSSIRRDASWFPEWSGESRGALEHPRLTSLVQDSSGMLWTLTAVPDAASDAGDGPIRIAQTDLNDHFDTVIEVIDPTTQRVFVRTKWPEYFPRFLGGQPVVFVRSEGQLGEILVTVLRLRVQEPDDPASGNRAH